MNAFQRSLAIESWTMYGIGVLLIAARIESRRIQKGSFRQLMVEEYIMIFILACFTVFTWSLNEVSMNGSNYMSHETAISLDAKGVQQAIWGSKCTMILEMFTLTILWGSKACLCLMFHRLTHKLGKVHLAVKIISGYCVLAFCLVVVLYLAYWCQPITGYWAVPVKERQCASYYHHLIFATAWNISADLMLFAIPLVVIPKLQLPLKRKIMILCVLCLGVFNILAAIMNRYYNFSHPNSVVYLRWYAGEVGTAVYIVNIPACRPLLQKVLRATGLSSTSLPTNEPVYASDPFRSSTHGRRHNKQPSPTESEIHLADVQSAQWPAKPAGGSHAVVQVGWRSDEEEEKSLPDDGIMRTTSVFQHSDMDQDHEHGGSFR